MRKGLGWWTAAWLVAMTSSSAAADQVWGTRSELLKEKAHRIALTIEPGHAELEVRRTVHNGGSRHDQALFVIDLPEGAVATGLRTLGLLAGKPHWFAGDLMEAGKAAERYRELTGISGYRWVKDPALLAWAGDRELSLQVFPVAPKAPKTVEYTLQIPTDYRNGRHYVRVPTLGTEELPATITAKAKPEAGRIFISDAPAGDDAEVPAEDGEIIEVSLAPRRAPKLGGALAVVPFAPERVLTRVRLEAAPKLSRVPRKARVVVLLDLSRSLAEDAAQAQVTAARAYLSHFADRGGKARVLTFDRTVRALQSRFVPAARAADDLGKLLAHRYNGSQIDDALVEAERILAEVPDHLPKRILLLTDTITRTALTESGIRGAMGPSGALVHVGLVVDGYPSLARTDDHDWSEAVRTTGGLVWHATSRTDGDAAGDDDHRTVFEQWARPVRIDHFRIAAPGEERGELCCQERLHEGEGMTAAWIDGAAMPWLQAEGELWAEPVRAVLRPDEREGQLWTALVFGSNLLHELSDEEMMTLAMKGGAVSPVTSYLAVEPGVRPSAEGLDHEGGGGRGEGIGYGSLGAIGHGGGVGPGGFDHQGYLKRQLTAAWQRCGGQGQAAVELETTLAEVVDVLAVTVPDASQSSCLREEAWKLVLPSAFRRVRSSKWSVTL